MRQRTSFERCFSSLSHSNRSRGQSISRWYLRLPMGFMSINCLKKYDGTDPTILTAR